MDCLASALGTSDSASVIDGLLESFCELLRLERHAVHLGVAVRVDQVLRPDQGGELAEVHLRYHYLAVTPKDVPEIPREGVQVAQMGLRDGQPRGAQTAYGGGDRPVRRAPAQHQGVCAVRVV